MSCSCCALATQGRAPNRSRFLVLGVIRLSSGPGRCISTVRRQPTSLSAPIPLLTIPPESHRRIPQTGRRRWEYHRYDFEYASLARRGADPYPLVTRGLAVGRLGAFLRGGRFGQLVQAA